MSRERQDSEAGLAESARIVHTWLKLRPTSNFEASVIDELRDRPNTMWTKSRIASWLDKDDARMRSELEEAD